MTSLVRPGAETRLFTRCAEVERLAALAAVLLVFLRIDLPLAHLDVTILGVVALAPVWLGSLSRYEGARILVVACAAALSAGLVLALVYSPVRNTNTAEAIQTSIELASFVGTMGVVLWARTHVPAHQVALVAGIGMLVTVSHSSGLYASNPWRFGYSIPVTIVVLAIAWWIGSRWFEIVCLLTLALVSGMNDARSNFAMLLLAAILLGWRMRAESASRRASWLPMAMLVGTVAWSVYHLVQTLILDGYLGQVTQQRSAEQIDASGSLIVGGRPELAAAVALIRDHPGGFGLGAIPRLDEILTAKAAMASINYDPDNGYVERYMFGDHFELHSVFGDLWASLGVAGLVLVAILVALSVKGMALSLRTGHGLSAIVIYLAIRALWGIAFSPFAAAATLIALFLGLVLVDRRSHEHQSASNGGTT
ncbi:hypothetical protein [Aeromicrobium sp.]|uniref:hypothetical protein n=1 Tax=Aeromicrobium sp. TaxID=1871063 RepID=UPI0019C3A4C4|nr:hypothetical protein [Aeromicrobium sp.]MBC7632323.1 hypothetical protein [Aeromicrobium sp.]